VLGALTVRAFAGADWEVRSGARHPRRNEVDIDLERPGSVAAALDEDLLVVNTVPRPELLAERLVLERGGALINTADLPASAGRSLRAIAAGARGMVLMNAGLAPGVTAVVAADLLRTHPDADELELVFMLSSTTPRGPASANFLHRGLTAVARHRTTRVPLPQPFGERVCLGFGEGEAGWLGGVAEGRVVRQYVYVSEPAAHEQLLALNSAAGMNALPRSLLGPREPPVAGAASDEPVAHWVAALRAGRRLGARTIECRGDFLHAARSTVVFGAALLTQQRRGGCFDPEEICTLGRMQGELRAAGVKVVPHSC
jgi:hypothetical protein